MNCVIALSGNISSRNDENLGVRDDSMLTSLTLSNKMSVEYRGLSHRSIPKSDRCRRAWLERYFPRSLLSRKCVLDGTNFCQLLWEQISANRSQWCRRNCVLYHRFKLTNFSSWISMRIFHLLRRFKDFKRDKKANTNRRGSISMFVGIAVGSEPSSPQIFGFPLRITANL